MAEIKIKEKISISGKLGPIVVYTDKYGKTYTREYVIPNNPKTEKQTACRNGFGMVSNFLSPFSTAIKRGYPGVSHAFNKVVGKTFKNALTGEHPNYQIDYRKIPLSEGPLPKTDSLKFFINGVNGEVVFEWNPTLAKKGKYGSAEDKVNIVYFNTKLNTPARTVPRGIRSDGRAELKLPEGWESCDTHFWLYFSSPDLKENSNCLYLTPG